MAAFASSRSPKVPGPLTLPRSVSPTYDNVLSPPPPPPLLVVWVIMSNGTLSIPTNLSPSHHILLQKQQEYAGLVQLREASAELLNKVEKLSEMSHIMADGGEGESAH